MAIQPIDLSTMYSQMDNVSKYSASQAQHATLLSQVAQETEAQADLEKSKSVQESAKDETESGVIKDDGQSGSGNASLQGEGGRKKNSRSETQEETEAPRVVKISNPALGQHIDITG